jgi:hypothetical protein
MVTYLDLTLHYALKHSAVRRRLLLLLLLLHLLLLGAQCIRETFRSTSVS